MFLPSQLNSVCMRVVFTLLLLFCINGLAFCQYDVNQNKVWVFGQNAGLDFTSGSPVMFTSNINALEGSVSVSDSVGNLLFYSIGEVVLDRTGDTMPNGNNLVNYRTWSSTQGSLIVPVIGSTSKYYLFSLQENVYSEPSPASFSRLYYSIIDMTLNGGLGDVMPGYKNIPLDSSLSEKMIAIRGNACNVWLMLHKRDSPDFVVYSISSAGIIGPIISHAGTFSGLFAYCSGVLKVSHDRQKIICQKAWPGPILGSELFDFDANSGIVSNCVVIDTINSNYGAEFSPDNSKLYMTQGPIPGGYYSIVQYDLSLPTIPSILASRTVLNTGMSMSLKLASDNMIYVSKQHSRFIGRINYPNVAGVGCMFVDSAMNLMPNYTQNGLPNLFVSPASSLETSIASTVNICMGTSIIADSLTTGGTWETSDPAIVTINPTSGLLTGISIGSAYITHTSLSGCRFVKNVHVDTVISSGIIIGPDTVCIGSTILYSSSHFGGVWSSTDSNSTISSSGYLTGISAGLSTITYTLSNACHSDTSIKSIYVNVAANSGIIIGPDTVCVGITNLYTSSHTGGVWSSVDSNSTISSSGYLTGTSAGLSSITYSVSNTCSYDSTIMSIYFDTVISSGIIAGSDTICVGITNLYTSSLIGGVWLSLDTNCLISDSGYLTASSAGICTITYTLSNACNSDSSIKSIVVVGSEYCDTLLKYNMINLEQKTIHVSPNPNSGEFYLEFPNKYNEKTSAYIINQFGQKIKEIVLPASGKMKIDLQVPSGVYYILINKSDVIYRNLIVIL